MTATSTSSYDSSAEEGRRSAFGGWREVTDERVNCGIGRRSRSTPEKIERALRHRDGFCCTFPGCNNRAYLNSHHIQFWELGGVTNMNNLTTVCHFHHKLIHKFGWRVALGDDGITRWFRPDGAPYRAGPAPPREPALTA